MRLQNEKSTEEVITLSFRCGVQLAERIALEAERNERDISKQIRFMLEQQIPPGTKPRANTKRSRYA